MNTSSKWQDADVDSAFNPLDSLYYNRARRKQGLPEQAYGISEGGSGYSNSTLSIGKNISKSAIDTNLTRNSLNNVSAERREYIQSAVDRFESSTPYDAPVVPLMVRGDSLIKQAARQNTITKNAISGTSGPSSSADTIQLGPQLYHPLYLTQNLQLPRDIITANSWNRAFYETNPIVRNAINLHATYPISKLNIKCEDKKVEQFFKDMMDRLDLETVVQQVALEFWRAGECFPYSEFDESIGSWGKIYVHNPDFISVKASPIPGSVTISLRPDPDLQRIITSNDPAHVKIRESLDPRIVHHVLMDEYIPLDSFNISHLKNLTSPYDIRGTSLIVSVWKDLMLYDRLRECHDVETEVLTNQGFKRYNEIMSVRPSDGEVSLAEGIEVACFNPETEGLEYHRPTKTILHNYEGKMVHFKGDKVDCMVTPNHRMNVSKKTNKGWTDWNTVLAGDIRKGSFYKFRSKLNWEGNSVEEINFAGKEVPADLFLEFLGYVISEGCIYSKGYDNKLIMSQLPIQPYYASMRETFLKISEIYNRKLQEKIKFQDCGFSSLSPKDIWTATICHKDLVLALKSEVGTDNKSDSFNKRLPRWVLDLCSSQLKILLEALVAGDGSIIPSKYGTPEKAYRYNTVSKQLADDVYELVYKCGFVPNMQVCKRDCRDYEEYTILWSDTNYGDFPLIYGNPNHGGANIEEVEYNDVVWCFEVPTDMFITRRNGKVTVQHNSKLAQADGMINPMTLVKIGASNPDGHYPTSEELESYRELLESAQYDQDFKLVTHDAVDIQRIGYNGATMDTAADFQFIIDNILMGLMVPKAVITQEGATYASASVALDVMRQRYNNFRTLMANWLEKKIFAPISEVQGFYKPEGGVKRLIVPQVEWNHMTLYDLDNYLGHVLGLIDKKKVSTETVYRSLGLNKAEEMANIRAEQIQAAILSKEEQALAQMNLSELRSLDPDKPVPERPVVALPGAPGGPGGDGMGDLLGAPPGLDLGGPPGMDLGGPLGGGGDDGGMGMAGGPDLGPGGPGGDLSAPPPGGPI